MIGEESLGGIRWGKRESVIYVLYVFIVIIVGISSFMKIKILIYVFSINIE